MLLFYKIKNRQLGKLKISPASEGLIPPPPQGIILESRNLNRRHQCRRHENRRFQDRRHNLIEPQKLVEFDNKTIKVYVCVIFLIFRIF